MSFQKKSYVTKFKEEQKGSFTLEASLIFPTILVVTIALILLSIVIYEKVVVYQKAHTIAERVAFTWDNSKKDFETGAFTRHEYTSKDDMDGLYWRTNHIGASFINAVFGADVKSVSGVKKDKAIAAAESMVDGSVKSIVIEEIALNPKVTVTLEVRLKIPEFVDLLTSSNFEATATASIKDPVELIRTTDFIFHYGQEIIDSLGE